MADDERGGEAEGEGEGEKRMRAETVTAETPTEAAATSSGETTTTTTTTCAACRRNEPKYTCPACGARTCSAACVKAHKSADRCDGKRREKFEFVPKEALTETHLARDLRFLERAAATTMATGGGGNHAPDAPHSGGDHKRKTATRKLVAAARRHGVRLTLAPEGMSLRASNTTRYDAKRDVIEWRVEVVLGSDPATLVNAVKRFDETLAAGDAVPEAVRDATPAFELVLEQPDGALVPLDRSRPLREALNGRVVREFVRLRLVTPAAVLDDM